MMKAFQVGSAATGVGLLMIVGSLLWPAFDDPTRQWTETDASQYEETVARVHEGKYLQAMSQSRPSMHRSPPVDQERLAQVREDQEKLEALTARLNDARDRPRRIAGALRWSGTGLVAVGAVLLLIGRDR